MFSCNPMEFSIKMLALHAEVNFTTALPYVYQSPSGSKHFCICSRKKNLQKLVCEPSCLLLCQDLSSHFRHYEFDGEDATRDTCL